MGKRSISCLLCDDVYSSVLDEFHFQISQGTSPNDVMNNIFKRSGEFCECITKLAIAECLWHVALVNQECISDAWRCLQSKELMTYLHSLGADEAYVKSFLKDATNMLNRLNAPLPEEENWLLSCSIDYQKGECFWYRYNNTVFGGVFLEKQRSYYLVALTESISTLPKDSDALLNQPLYTLSWFSDETLLPKNRIHSIGRIEVTCSFVNKYGIFENSGALIINNYGQSLTWKHCFRMLNVDFTLAELIASKR